ncbi:hypothetical protein NUW54_g13127 [Trametes sanguinea]|uniref:Uncharacterized protein n=1 Tax=Trametes sanguinea TaxID=158606 RepID=A0ACC1MPK1_9APHY|nr:hypothetical protein NUW54_g13127 [Trametes sanguinea]
MGMLTDRLGTVWFQHYRKENFHDESLPPGKWTKRESKQNWRLIYLQSIPNRPPPMVPPSGYSSPRSGDRTPREIREDKWKEEAEAAVKPSKIEMRAMYKELGGRKARDKGKLGGMSGMRDKGEQTLDVSSTLVTNVYGTGLFVDVMRNGTAVIERSGEIEIDPPIVNEVSSSSDLGPGWLVHIHHPAPSVFEFAQPFLRQATGAVKPTTPIGPNQHLISSAYLSPLAQEQMSELHKDDVASQAMDVRHEADLDARMPSLVSGTTCQSGESTPSIRTLQEKLSVRTIRSVGKLPASESQESAGSMSSGGCNGPRELPHEPSFEVDQVGDIRAVDSGWLDDDVEVWT